jgi:hypothetical protein
MTALCYMSPSKAIADLINRLYRNAELQSNGCALHAAGPYFPHITFRQLGMGMGLTNGRPVTSALYAVMRILGARSFEQVIRVAARWVIARMAAFHSLSQRPTEFIFQHQPVRRVVFSVIAASRVSSAHAGTVMRPALVGRSDFRIVQDAASTRAPDGSCNWPEICLPAMPALGVWSALRHAPAYQASPEIGIGWEDL